MHVLQKIWSTPLPSALLPHCATTRSSTVSSKQIPHFGTTTYSATFIGAEWDRLAWVLTALEASQEPNRIASWVLTALEASTGGAELDRLARVLPALGAGTVEVRMVWIATRGAGRWSSKYD